MPPYPSLPTDYGAGAHAAIFMVRDYDPTDNYNNLLDRDRVIRQRDAMISHLNWRVFCAPEMRVDPLPHACNLECAAQSWIKFWHAWNNLLVVNH
eukprot:366390-Chlamydomonas_euryale.AAC.23